jgi:hypothetical protein
MGDIVVTRAQYSGPRRSRNLGERLMDHTLGELEQERSERKKVGILTARW